MSVKYTTPIFIAKAKEIHGDKYDYSKVSYVDSVTKVCIVCPEHGEFWQRPALHLMGNGCQECSKDRIKAALSDTTETFIEKAHKVHGDRYDYSKAEYKGNEKKVIIICPDHGEFLQTPHSHLTGAGCAICSGNVKDTTESFIAKAKSIHGDRYDYSKVNYVRSQEKVTIICREHGPFEQKPNSHLLGQGCPVCGGTKLKTRAQFLLEARKVHGYKYDYSKAEYVNDATKVCIICSKHGEFWQRPNSHLKGNGCHICRDEYTSQRFTLPKETFLERARSIHHDKYDYSKIDYVNTHTKVCIICPEHGEFWQEPYTHTIQGCGCPTCGELSRYESRKKYHEWPMELAQKAHGNRYDYSKVDYDSLDRKVCITCREHGDFWQTPRAHFLGQKCPHCAIEENAKLLRARYLQEWRPVSYLDDEEVRKARLENFIERAREVHGNRYDYSKSEYTGISEKVCIICPDHGEFWQNANNHLRGSICPKCAGRHSPTTEEFIEKARLVHGNRYDYSLVDYRTSKDKISLLCQEHGEFWITPNAHLLGGGCPLCAPNHKMDTTSFIEKARKRHGDRYDYSLVNYVDCTTPVTIICADHGEFKQVPSAHLGGYNCPKCSGRYMDTEYFKEVASERHDGKYDYSLVEYKGATEYVTIICPVHGQFRQKAANHLSGNGCPRCKESHIERDVRRLLNKNNIKFEQEKSFDWLFVLGPLYLDFYLPEYNIAIECQGLQHFEPIDYFGGQAGYDNLTMRDNEKRMLCEMHGIQVIYYSDLGIDYPYPVIEDLGLLLKVIKDIGLADDPAIYSDPELPLEF